ncbi:MAG: serine/threonine-protein kinase, partial [candidate division WOR-3 bacterium]
MTGFDGQENINVLRQLNERYEPLELLGRSEFNEVYKVKDRLGRRIVALKVLQKNASREAGLRLSREFFYLSQLAHPNIVRVFDYGLAIDNSPFFTMEFVPGVPITRFFRGYQPALLEVLIQLLSALDAIHREGLVHCDIKPSNILVYDDEGKPVVKLLDLGFVEGMAFSSASPRGTLGYIAPELLKGGEADSRTDLYSLGLVLYEILTGVGPASGGSLEEWLRRQYYSGFEPVSKFNPAVPAALDNLVLRLLNPDSRRRPASAEHLLEELVSAGLLVPESFRMQTIVEPSVIRRNLLAPAFVGRGPLIARLKELLGEAAIGKPGVVFISGERGAGKSRLLGEFKFLAQLEQATVIAFEPVALGARTQSLVESLINLLWRGEEVETGISLEFFQESKFQLFEQLVRRLKALSDSHRVPHSLVLLVDDFELFDPLSLEFVRYLALSLEQERLLLVITGLREKRLLDLVSELSERPYCYHLDVDTLDREAVRELVTSIVGGDDNVDELVDWVYEFGGGNPLATIEVIYSMIEQGVIFREGLHWRYSPDSLRNFVIPKNVAELVRHRLEVLTPEERELLEVGAITAGPF